MSRVPIETLSYIFIVDQPTGPKSGPIWAELFFRGGLVWTLVFKNRCIFGGGPVIKSVSVNRF